ncbi:hypothetical protein F4861DRAFT_211269 [Xylaria intraflava]|nr:hypothetical protein F4861DRAFT_211269 [Xylaria intraflava]
MPKLQMARPHPNLPALFAQALKTFESSDSTFRVLCSLRSSSAAPANLLAEPPRRPPKHILVLDSSFNPPTLAHHRMVTSALSDPRYKASVSQDKVVSDPERLPDMRATSRVLLLLAINNADKAPKPASFPQRLAMMYVFAQGILAEWAQRDISQSNTQADAAYEAVDIAVTTEPYFHAKAQAIAKSDFYYGAREWGQSDSAAAGDTIIESDQVYLTGYDTIIRIFNPKYYPNNTMKASLDPFFAYARLRVTMRTDDAWGDAAKQVSYLDELRAGALEAAGGRVEWIDKIEMVQGRRDDEAIISSTKVRDAVNNKDWGALKELVGEGVVTWIRDNGLYTTEGQ